MQIMYTETKQRCAECPPDIATRLFIRQFVRFILNTSMLLIRQAERKKLITIKTYILYYIFMPFTCIVLLRASEH